MNKYYKNIIILCLLILFLNFISFIIPTKSIAATPDAPNIKPLSSLKEGDSVFFADMEWIVLNPSEGKLISRQDIFSLPNFKSSDLDYSSYRNAFQYLNSTFLNALNSEDRDLIEERTENGLTGKIFLPNENDIKNSKQNTKFIITEEEKKVAISNPNIDSSVRAYYYCYDIDHDYMGYADVELREYTTSYDSGWSCLKPALYLPTTTKLIVQSDEGISLVVGGQYQLTAPKGTTKKFYFYDRYLIKTSFSALEGNFKTIGYRRIETDSPSAQNLGYNTPLFSRYEFKNNKYYGDEEREINENDIERHKNGTGTGSGSFYSPLNNNNESYKYGYPKGAAYFDDYNVYWYAKYWSKRICVSTTGFSRGSQVGSYFLGKDNQYPINGVHSDGYWYIRRQEANIEGLGEVDVDNLSEQLKKDIMPVITVLINQNFDEVVQGRGYITNGTSVNTSDGNVTVFRQDSNYIRVRGNFTQTGIKYVEIPDTNGKKAYFLFNVIEDPAPGSASGITF